MDSEIKDFGELQVVYEVPQVEIYLRHAAEPGHVDVHLPGAPAVVVAVQLLVTGLYLPPVFKSPLTPPYPPHTIISLPLQTAV